MQKLTVVLCWAFLCVSLNANSNAPMPGAKTCSRVPQSSYRIFVTKVYPGRGVLSAADFKQLADAGFTTVVARWKRDLTAYAQGAAAVDLNSMN